jgi:hypothetical protein
MERSKKRRAAREAEQKQGRTLCTKGSMTEEE